MAEESQAQPTDTAVIEAIETIDWYKEQYERMIKENRVLTDGVFQLTTMFEWFIEKDTPGDTELSIEDQMRLTNEFEAFKAQRAAAAAELLELRERVARCEFCKRSFE